MVDLVVAGAHVALLLVVVAAVQVDHLMVVVVGVEEALVVDEEAILDRLLEHPLITRLQTCYHWVLSVTLQKATWSAKALWKARCPISMPLFSKRAIQELFWGVSTKSLGPSMKCTLRLKWLKGLWLLACLPVKSCPLGTINYCPWNASCPSLPQNLLDPKRPGRFLAMALLLVEIGVDHQEDVVAAVVEVDVVALVEEAAAAVALTVAAVEDSVVAASEAEMPIATKHQKIFLQ